MCGSHEGSRSGMTFTLREDKVIPSPPLLHSSRYVLDFSYPARHYPAVWHPGESWPLSSWTVIQMTNVPAGGYLQLGLQFTPPPSNDDFHTLPLFPATEWGVAASNAGASINRANRIIPAIPREFGLVFLDCSGLRPGPSDQSGSAIFATFMDRG